jgi:hypothetical protein
MHDYSHLAVCGREVLFSMDAFVMVDGDEAGNCKRKRECLRALGV